MKTGCSFRSRGTQTVISGPRQKRMLNEETCNWNVRIVYQMETPGRNYLFSLSLAWVSLHGLWRWLIPCPIIGLSFVFYHFWEEGGLEEINLFTVCSDPLKPRRWGAWTGALGWRWAYPTRDIPGSCQGVLSENVDTLFSQIQARGSWARILGCGLSHRQLLPH